MSVEFGAADLAHRAEMRTRVRRAADHFSLSLVGESVFSGQDRTIGSRARASDRDCWLRVSWSHGYWVPGDFWTGNQDAAAIVGVPEPTPIREPYDWEQTPYV